MNGIERPRLPFAQAYVESLADCTLEELGLVAESAIFLAYNARPPKEKTHPDYTIEWENLPFGAAAILGNLAGNPIKPRETLAIFSEEILCMRKEKRGKRDKEQLRARKKAANG